MLELRRVMKTMIDYKNIGMRIGLRRRELRITQKEIAEKIGVTDKYISNIETGKRNVNLEMLSKFCEILRATPDYFLLGTIRKDIESNIVDCLKLCSEEDKLLIYSIVEKCAERNRKFN